MKTKIQYFFILLFFIFNESIYAQQVYSYPYKADFEWPDYESGWYAVGNTSWEWGNLNTTNILNGASSGTRGWITNLGANYFDYEDGWLESPEFDFTDLISPKIEFDLWWLCDSYNDGAVFQSSTDGGNTWQNVGAFGDPDWFNYDSINVMPANQGEGWTSIDGDDQIYGSGWITMQHSLSHLSGQSSVYFRLVFASDDWDNSEGFAFDLVKVYDDAIAYIPDTQFEQYLIDNAIDSDGVINGQVLKSDISGVTSLNTSAYNISNFEGLQFFTALTGFSLIDNSTPNVYNLNFEGNLVLQDVYIENCPGVDDVRGLRSENLTSVIINTNSTFAFYLGLGWNLPNLTIIDVAQSNIYSLALYDFPNLTELNISNNPITDVDFSQLPSLQSIALSYTSVEYLDLQNNVNLTDLHGNNSALLEVKLDNGFNNSLTYVDLSNNPSLTCIQVDNAAFSNTAGGWIKDVTASYSEDCEFPIREFPYFEDFENGNQGWNVVDINNSSWELGTPSSTNLNTVASGANAWVTNLDGNHNSNENSYVMSPEFNFSSFDGFDELYAQFDVWYDLETGIDGVVFQSSIDGGVSWQNVGNLDSEYSINHYTSDNHAGNPGGQPIGWSGSSVNIFSNGWKKAVFNIGGFADGSLVGELSVYFRIAFGSNSSIVNEGFAFDNFSIDQSPCYAGEDAVHNNICTVNENGNYLYRIYLGNYLVGANEPGTWTSLDGFPFADEYENSIDPQQVTQSGSYKFKFTKSNCDESIIELNIEKKLDVGNNSEFFDNNTTEACSDLSFETDEAFQQWAFDTHVAGNTTNVDPGGIWTPSSFQGYGYYTYSHPATSTCPETSSTFLYNKQAPIETYEYIQTTSDVTNLFVLIDDLESNRNINKVSLQRRGRWVSNYSSVEDDGTVDFPNTGTGPYYITYNIDYIDEDECGNIISITHYTISVLGQGNGGEDGILSICNGETITENDLFDALGGNPSNVGYWTPEINGPGTYTYWYEPFQGEEMQFWEAGGTVTVTETPLLKLSMFLQGPYNQNTGWMNNKLVTNNLIPTISPYSDALELPISTNFTQDIVDWIWIELRDATNQANIPLSRSALLKRNGDVVDIDNFKPIQCNIPEGDYYLFIDHRNHLEVITLDPISISCGTTIVDLRSTNTLIFGGENALADLGYGDIGLFAGDVNNDSIIQYSGAIPEGTNILSYVLNHPSNFLSLPTFSIEGYSNYDVDMDGQTQYAGGNSEMPLILQNVLTNPSNFLNLITWPIEAQLPDTTEE